MAAGSNVELSLISVTSTQVSIVATILSGTSESGQIVYFVDNVEVARGSTISIVGGTSTSDTMTGLTSGTEYTAKFYSQTEGDYSQSTLTFTTLSSRKLYGSANSQSQLVNTLYGGSAGGARKINKLYGSVNGEAKLIHQDFGHNNYLGKVVYYTDNTYTTTADTPIMTTNEARMMRGDGYSDSWTTTVGGVTVGAQNIKEVYLYEGITYLSTYFLSHCRRLDRVDLSRSGVTIILNDFMDYCEYFNGTLLLPPNLTEIRGNFMAHCYRFDQTLSIPDTVTTIGNGFMYFCADFNQSLTLPSSLTSIGDQFMGDCEAFNKPLTLPTGLETIGKVFLWDSNAFNQDITLPSGLTSIGEGFLGYLQNMIGTVSVEALDASVIESDGTYHSFIAKYASSPTYTTGIKIAGANRQAWLSKFPNSSSDPYRKLIDAGY